MSTIGGIGYPQKALPQNYLHEEGIKQMHNDQRYLNDHWNYTIFHGC